MSKIKAFIKKEVTLCVSFAAAAISCIFVPPDAAYAGYIDLRTMALLYCLMVVVAGLGSAGMFRAFARGLLIRAHTVRAIGIVLVALCFFSSMLITNDVAILTFVPLAVVVLGLAGREKELALTVVLQTVAANLGSMLTPVGNPQNLYLYSYYSMTAKEFFSATGPVWLASGALLLPLCLLLPKTKLDTGAGESEAISTRSLVIYLALLAVCMLVVFRVLPWQWMLAAVICVLLLFDRKTLAKADFFLLLTFLCFFVFAGNLARISSVDALLRSLLSGHELLASAAASQLISNVPAAILLSGFTENARALLLGVDIGGLGTPIASLASLIGLKLYSRTQNANTGRFMALFLAVNFGLLAVLLLLGVALS